MRSRTAKTIRNLARDAAVPLIAGGGAVLLLDVARRVFRQSQLFCPERKAATSWNPEDYGVPPGAAEEHWFESPDGELLYGWYCRAKNPIASAVFCHGNSGNLTTVARMIPHLLDSGISVLFFDYRGFGRSTGIASMRGVVSDGITAARFHDQLRPRHLPSILYGFSLGGAIAAQVLRHHHFDGLILQSTFTSLPHIARVVFPRLPLHLFAGNFFDTLSVVKRLRVPLLIMHGTDDEVVPCWMAHALHDACSGVKSIQIVEGGLHKDLFERDPDSLVWAVNRFATDLAATRTNEQQVEQPSMTDLWIDAAWRLVRRGMRRRMAPQSL